MRATYSFKGDCIAYLRRCLSQPLGLWSYTNRLEACYGAKLAPPLAIYYAYGLSIAAITGLRPHDSAGRRQRRDQCLVTVQLISERPPQAARRMPLRFDDRKWHLLVRNATALAASAAATPRVAAGRRTAVRPTG